MDTKKARELKIRRFAFPLTRRDRSSLPLAALVVAATTIAAPAIPGDALPANPAVTSGNVAYTRAGNTLTASQTSQFAATTWSSFSIGKDAAVVIHTPGPNSISLNRVSGADGTRISGKLTSNGRVFLSNPNGVVFTQGAKVETAALLATSLEIAETTSDGPKFRLTGLATGQVINEGTITTGEGGFVFLAAAKVTNRGILTSPGGSIVLAAGQEIDLTLGGESGLTFTITKGALDALVANHDAIVADGGRVMLTAKGADEAVSAVVNNTGTIAARTVRNVAGKIYLLADDTTQVDGSLDASAPHGGPGGFIETSAQRVQVAATARIDTSSVQGAFGTWLIDPTDFTITEGSAPLSGAGIGASVLSNALGSNNVIISAALLGGTGISDIHVNAPVAWSSPTKLTLSANNNIYINAPVTVTNAGGSLSLEYGLGAVSAGNLSDYYAKAPVNLPAGNTFTTKLGSDGLTNSYLVITQLGTWGDTSGTTLQGLQPYLNTYPPYRYVALGADIDASPTSNWDSGRGFAPLDSASMLEFAGLGHRIDNLTISRPSTTTVGFFGQADAIFKDLGITNSYISGRTNVGAIAGFGSGAFINCYTSNCRIVSSGGSNVNTGGIAGTARYVSDSYSENADIWAYAGTRAGGIVGSTYVPVAVGGKMGDLPSDLIERCWSSGIIHGSDQLGGIIGTNFGHVADSYSVAYVYSDYTGRYDVGGIIGQNWYGSASGCHSTFNIYGTSQSSLGATPFYSCYAAYQSTQFGGSGVTAFGNGNERVQASYANFDFTNTWWMKEGSTRPMLRSERRNYIRNSHELQLAALSPGGSYHLLYDLDLTNELIDNLAYYRNIWSGKGFVPIGDATAGFSGTFDGEGKTINALTIETPTESNVGLFGMVVGGTIRNITLTNASVSGNAAVGQLVGMNDGGTISQGHANGVSTGSLHVGGLVGGAYGNSLITDSSSTGTVNNSGSRAGGLVGENFSSTSSIRRSYSTSTVNGSWLVGGLVGYLVGDVSDSYARGNVNGGTDAGGLIGRIDGGTVSRVYSRGRVSGTSGLGGLVGVRVGPSTFNDAYWELESSYQANSAAGTSFTYSRKARHSTYAGFDFVNTWGISVNLSYQDTYPELRSQADAQYLQTPIFVKANPGTSVYGESPAISFGVYYQPDGSGQPVSGATISGTPSWTGGPSSTTAAGTYSMTYGSGLSITFSSGYYAILAENPTTWEVSRRPIALSAITASKTYGNADPTLAFGVQSTAPGVGLANTDTITGSLVRSSGESVGTRTINQGTLNVSTPGNYDVTFQPADLTISRRAITLAAQSVAKAYGDADPTIAVSIAGGSLGTVTVSDTLGDVTGPLSRAPGENVGAYAIYLGAGVNAANYDITFQPANLSISRRAITLAAQSVAKAYGDADPALAASIAAGSLGAVTVGDTLGDVTGPLSRAPGETVGTYAISLGAGVNAANYDITFQPADLTISRRAITLAAQGFAKIYGDADPTLAVSIAAGSLGAVTVSDTLGDVSGTLSRAPGENVGAYAISLGAGVNAANYDITFQPANLSISRRAITLAAQSVAKAYGDADPALAASIAAGSLGAVTVGDTLGDVTGPLSRAPGETVGTYAISLGAGVNAANYDITFQPANLSISRRAITVAALAASKTSGDPDPTLSYTLIGTLGPLPLSGSLSRQPGEFAGTYAILRGGLTNLDNPNYDISFVSADFQIELDTSFHHGLVDLGKTIPTFRKPKGPSLLPSRAFIPNEAAMYASDGDTSPDKLTPGDISPAALNSTSPIEVLDGGVRLPAGHKQLFYLKKK